MSFHHLVVFVIVLAVATILSADNLHAQSVQKERARWTAMLADSTYVVKLAGFPFVYYLGQNSRAVVARSCAGRRYCNDGVEFRPINWSVRYIRSEKRYGMCPQTSVNGMMLCFPITQLNSARVGKGDVFGLSSRTRSAKLRKVLGL